jgi:hypothetical protein
MPVRFRKIIKIAPGVKLNLSKGGVSFTFGKKGYHINVGKHGVRQTVGIPGSGISHTSYLGKDDDNGEKDKEGMNLPEVAAMAMAANAMTDNDEKDSTEREARDEPKTRPGRKSTRKRGRRQRRNSPMMLSFVFLGALVFFCAGAAVLGLIPSDFANNVGHVMVQWAQQFGR